VRRFGLAMQRVGGTGMKKSCALGFAAITVAVILTGCLSPPPGWTTPTTSNGTYVGVLGDSITYSTQGSSTTPGLMGTLTNDLTAQGFPASVSSDYGATTSDLNNVSPFPAPGPTILVIALGSNDSYMGQIPLATSQSNLQNYLAASPAKCVYLVNVNTVTASWDLPTYGPPYNAMLQSLANNSNGRIHVADWASEVDAHPSYLDASGGPHLSAAGITAYRALLERSVWNCAADLNVPPSTTVTVPVEGATVSAGQPLDASASPWATSVQYELTGGALNDVVIATATPTLYGWLTEWNTTNAPNGTYTLQSVASDGGGDVGTSPSVTITVNN
jgi:GDSL-like Lipase/Acylhydrolase family